MVQILDGQKEAALGLALEAFERFGIVTRLSGMTSAATCGPGGRPPLITPHPCHPRRVCPEFAIVGDRLADHGGPAGVRR